MGPGEPQRDRNTCSFTLHCLCGFHPRKIKADATHALKVTAVVKESAQEHPTPQRTLPSSWPPNQFTAAQRQDSYERDGREEGIGVGCLFPIISTFLPFHKHIGWQQLLKATTYLTVFHWKFTLPKSFILNSALIQHQRDEVEGKHVSLGRGISRNKHWAGLAWCLAEAYSKYFNPSLEHPCTGLCRASKKLFSTAGT